MRTRGSRREIELLLDADCLDLAMVLASAAHVSAAFPTSFGL